MSDSVSFKNLVTEKDSVQAMRVFYRTSRWRWISCCLFFGLCIVFIAALGVVAYLKDGISIGLGVALVGEFLIGGVLWWAWTWQPRRMARKSPHVGVEFETEFSSGGIKSSSSLGSGQLNWAIYTSARETADYFILFSGVGLFYSFPKRHIASPQDVVRLRELIRNNVPKTKLLSS